MFTFKPTFLYNPFLPPLKKSTYFILANLFTSSILFPKITKYSVSMRNWVVRIQTKLLL